MCRRSGFSLVWSFCSGSVSSWRHRARSRAIHQRSDQFCCESSQKIGEDERSLRFSCFWPDTSQIVCRQQHPTPGSTNLTSPLKKLLTLITPPCYSAASLLTKPASNLPPRSHHLRMVRGVYAA